jgi:hypothetical protein
LRKAELIAAYTATHYHIHWAEGAFMLRVNEHCPSLAALYARRGYNCAAFLTAWNPYSQLTSPIENHAMQQALLADLERHDCWIIPGIGLDPAGLWMGEESFLAIGLGLADAQRLGRQYRQNAILWMGEDAVPRLEWLVATSLTSPLTYPTPDN